MNSRYTASLRNQYGFAAVAGVLLVGLIALTGLFAQTASATEAKENICHGTSSETNPWNAIEINTSALATHLGEGDFLYEGPVKDNGKPANGGDEWCKENAPKVEVDIPSECIPNDDLVIYSDTETQVNGNDAVVTAAPHSAWVSTVTTDLPSTNWIWNTEKSSLDDSGTHPAGTLTFTREFVIEGTPVGAELLITADNEYTVSINGNPLGADTTWQTAEPYSIDASLLIEGGINTLTIVATNGAGETGNPAGLNFKLTVESEDCPEPSFTVNAYKFVCSDVTDLPEYGAGGTADMSDALLEEWRANDGDSCEEVRWGFQWVTAEDSNSNPGDETEIAPEPWSEAFYGSVEIPLEAPALVWFREVFDTDYIGFSGGTNDPAGDSAEFYCYNDALNFDNWDWINAAPGEEYNCIAWNVPLKPAEPNFCEGNLLNDGGFESPEVVLSQLWQLFQSQALSWQVDWISGGENDTPVFELQKNGVINSWAAAEGDQYLELDSDRLDTQANTNVWQEIDTESGKTYKLTYEFAARPGTNSADNETDVYWNGVKVQDITGDATGNSNTVVWTSQEITGLSGLDGLSKLEFKAVGTSNEYGSFIDKACLVEVPEEACRLEVVSLEGDEGVGNGDAVEAWNHPSWATDLNAFADWIWDAEYVNDPEVDEARTFAKSFWVTGPVNDAALTFAADNRYWIEINGDPVISDTGEFNYGATQSLDVTSYIDEDALNIITLKVENIGIVGETQEGNPAAGIYRLVVNAEAENMCEPVDIPECSDGLDNDGDYYTDYEGQDPGCDSPEDNDESNEPEGPDYAAYCGDGVVGNPEQEEVDIDQSWEQCDEGPLNGTEQSSCNQFCQLTDSQCTDLVLARINSTNIVNTPDDVSNADMTSDVWIGGDEEGVNNIPGGVWFAVYLNGSAVDDLDFGAYDSYEDVPGYAVNRDEGMVRVRMHGDHDNELIREHAQGNIEIRHAYSGNSVLMDMQSQLGQNKLEFPFNGTTGSVTQPGNDELNLGGFGNFWMVVGPDDDGFRAEYVVGEELSCENPSDGGSITIDKVVAGEGANGDLPFDFDLSWLDQDVDASISGNDEPETFSGLAEGSYTVTELISSDDDWYVTDVTCDNETYYHDAGEGDFEVVLGEDEDVTCTITNTYRPESNGDSCLVEGFKYDEGGNPLAGWYIGLEGYYYPEYSLQEVVIYDEQLIGSDITDENGYYCIEGEVEGPGSNYSVFEVIQEGWDNISAEVNGSEVSEYYDDGDIASVEIGYLGDGMDVNFINQYEGSNDEECSDEVDNDNDEDVDENDSDCQKDTPETPSDDDDDDKSSNRRRGGRSGGRVLGASTEGFCPFLKDYLHINMQNDPTEVNKAKAFFNSYLGKTLILDGVFDKDLFVAAVEFQNMFKNDVLETWVEEFSFLDDNATGYIYQTTKWKINSILCPGYEAFPDQLIVANGTTVNL